MRKVKDIRHGRTYRKRTNPMPVFSPVKGKTIPTTKQSDAGTEDIEAVTVKVNETQSLNELNLFEKGPKVTRAKLLSDGKNKERNYNDTVKEHRMELIARRIMRHKWGLSSQRKERQLCKL